MTHPNRGMEAQRHQPVKRRSPRPSVDKLDLIGLSMPRRGQANYNFYDVVGASGQN